MCWLPGSSADARVTKFQLLSQNILQMTNFLCCEMWCFNRQIFLRRLSCNENLLQTQLTLTSLCSVHRNPPRFQTSTPMRKHGPTTCLAWTPAGVLTPQLLPCSHGRKAAIVRPTLAQKVSRWFFLLCRTLLYFSLWSVYKNVNVQNNQHCASL